MSTTVVTGVVRNPTTGKIAGQLTFIDPQSLAGVVGSLPGLAGGVAMQLMLLQIEKSLERLSVDLGYLIRSEHLKVEAGIETNLEILHDVHAATRRHGAVEDDQWDRVANVEASVRSLHKETKKHLRSLEEALGGEGQRLAVRVARLNRALGDERTVFWLRAHVHAELALARWDAIYLLRQVPQHPEALSVLVAGLYRQVEERNSVLANLSRRVAQYLASDRVLTIWTDRFRLIRRTRLKSLLLELDEVLKAFPPDLQTSTSAPGTAIPLGDGSPERQRWNELVSRAAWLPQTATNVLGSAKAKMSHGVVAGHRGDTQAGEAGYVFGPSHHTLSRRVAVRQNSSRLSRNWSYV